MLNVLASQVATALDTLNFALMTERSHPSDTRMSPRAPRNSRHGLRPRIITERISSDRSRSPTRIRTRPLDTSSTWYKPASSPPREAHRDAADNNSGRRPESMLDHLPPPRPLAPLAPHGGREPGQMTPTTPDSDSDGSVRPHPGASSFRPSPTVVHGPRELLQEFTIALRNAHHEPSRHGHRVSRMRWCDGRKTRIPGPPTKPLLGSFRSPLRKSSRHGRSTSNLRLAARNPVIKCTSDHRRTKW